MVQFCLNYFTRVLRADKNESLGQGGNRLRLEKIGLFFLSLSLVSWSPLNYDYGSKFT